jgi:hypothetical protein
MSPLSASRVHWRDAISTPRDLRRVQSHSTFNTTEVLADPASYELTPRPADACRGSFEEILNQSAYIPLPNRRFELRLDRVDHQSDHGAGYVYPSFSFYQG